MNKPKLKVMRRYLGPALYDLIRSEQSAKTLPAVTGPAAKLIKKGA